MTEANSENINQYSFAELVAARDLANQGEEAVSKVEQLEDSASKTRAELARVVLKAVEAGFTVLTPLEKEVAKKMAEDLSRARRMEALGILAGGVAHDMNNVLAVILGYASILQTKLDPEYPGLDYIKEILRACYRGMGMVRNLLEFGCIKSSAEHETLDLNGEIRDMTFALHEIAKAGVTGNKSMAIVMDLTDAPVDIEGDSDELKRILENLVSNARDAMPDEGEKRLTIKTESCYVDGENIVKLIVEDTGKGIEKENVDKVFDPFFTTKDRSKGTGLGLAIVERILIEHNATVRVDSVLGNGTTFTIAFPASDKEAV